MSNVEDLKGEAVKSYNGFEEGTYAARKGRLCFIKKIHFEMHPPSVTVQMMDTDTEVGTEFDRLQHLHSWFCDMCTAENTDVQAKKCFFCKMDRSYKEKITVVDETTKVAPSQQPQQQQQQKQPPMEDKSVQQEEEAVKDEETSDEVSEESKTTDDEYETVPEQQAKISDHDHELPAEEEEPVPEHQAHAQVHPKYGNKQRPPHYPQEQQYAHWPSYHEFGAPHPAMQRHGNEPVSGAHEHVPTAQNRSQRARPRPDGQRRAAPNRQRTRRTRSQPRRFWMDDDDAVQFRRPLHSYWPRSWWDWDL